MNADAQTDPLHFSIEDGTYALAIRLSPAEPWSDLCLQLIDVQTDTGAHWVGHGDGPKDWSAVCTDCSRLVAVSHGYALYVFPNDGHGLEDVGGLEFKVEIRDCLTLLPAAVSPLEAWPESILVETATWTRPTLASPLRLYFLNAGHPLDVSVGDFAEAIVSPLRETFEKSGLTVSLVGSKNLPIGAAKDTLTYSSVDHGDLEDLASYANTFIAEQDDICGPSIPVILVPCIEYSDLLSGGATHPLGLTMHLPGGLPTLNHADALFLAPGNCGGLTLPALAWEEASWMNLVLAHEVGHLLGLFHVGTPAAAEDGLEDTTPDAPNIMSLHPWEQQRIIFSPQQMEVIRRHPLFGAPGLASIAGTGVSLGLEVP